MEAKKTLLKPRVLKSDMTFHIIRKSCTGKLSLIVPGLSATAIKGLGMGAGISLLSVKNLTRPLVVNMCSYHLELIKSLSFRNFLEMLDILVVLLERCRYRCSTHLRTCAIAGVFIINTDIKFEEYAR